MISFTPKITSLYTAIVISILLSACGGGSSTSGESSFTASNSNPNTKPQTTSSESSASSVKNPTSLSSASSNTSKSSSSIKPPPGGDSAAPTIPTKFTLASAFPDVVFLSWERASDNIGVVAYKVFRDGIQIAETEELENYYADYTVAANKTYEYGVSAGDAVGNWSSVVTLKAVTPKVSQISSSSSSKASISSSSTNSISSSKASSSTNSISSSKASSSTSSMSSSKASSSAVAIGVSFQWQRPLFRENGTDMYEHEIARYEIRYKLPNETNFITTLVMSPLVSKSLPDIPSNAYFEIATIDTAGAYSRFVPIRPL